MKKIRLVESILILIMVLALLTTGIYAWIIARFASDPIIFTSGSITVDADFYVANDANKDGLLDGGYTEITSGGIDFTNLIPGQIYTFRLIVENTGTANGTLSVQLSDIIPSNPTLYNLMVLNYTNPTTSNLEVVSLDALDVPLFNNYVLEMDEILTLDFTIKIEPTINNTLHNSTISISYIEVRLDQIVNP